MNLCSILRRSVAHHLVLLSECIRRIWLLRTFFRENWVYTKVRILGWSHILAPKGPNKDFLKQPFIQEGQKLYCYQYCDFKTD